MLNESVKTPYAYVLFALVEIIYEFRDLIFLYNDPL